MRARGAVSSSSVCVFCPSVLLWLCVCVCVCLSFHPPFPFHRHCCCCYCDGHSLHVMHSVYTTGWIIRDRKWLPFRSERESKSKSEKERERESEIERRG